MQTLQDPDFLYVADFEPDHQNLYARLCSDVVWDERIRARKTASFGTPYNYSGLTYAAVPMPDSIVGMRSRVAARLGWTANNALLNFYPDGRSTMGYHPDEIDNLEPGTGIAIVSLGTERTIRFRAVADKTRIIERRLGSGSLLWMSLSMQIGWRHGIFAEDTDGGRISVTFRRLAGG